MDHTNSLKHASFFQNTEDTTIPRNNFLYLSFTPPITHPPLTQMDTMGGDTVHPAATMVATPLQQEGVPRSQILTPIPVTASSCLRSNFTIF